MPYKDPQEQQTYMKAYDLMNKERRKAQKKAHNAAHPYKRNMWASNKRAKKMERTPLWADMNEIQKMYRLAHILTEASFSDTEYHVDHVIPLQGDIVSGLHTHINMQVLTADANRRKWNRY